jgi:simple sugar transport system permease protein
VKPRSRGPGRIAGLLSDSLGLLATLAVALLAAALLVLLFSEEPGRAIYYLFAGPFQSRFSVGNLLGSAVPLVLTGLGMALAFQAAVFNLGGEGQVYAGALAATAVLLGLPQAGGWLGGPAGLLAGLLAGAALAGISGWLRMKWGTDELISSFLLSAAAILVVDYFITGPLDDPASSLLATRAVGQQYWLVRILPPSRLDTGAPFVLLMAGLAWLGLYSSRWGYELRMCGHNREFARYGGIRVAAYLVLPMIASGALHGLAGGLSILGTYHMALKGFSQGMGWNGIAVALIARSHPLGVVPAALFLAWLFAGAGAATLHAGVPIEVAAVAQSVIFYLITARSLHRLLRGR